MPIVNIEMVGEEPLEPELADRLADSLAAVFGGDPSGTWVRLRPLRRYAEGGGGPPPGVAPIFVSVLLANPPVGTDREDQVSAVTSVVAETCARLPENVHVIYEAAGAGRVAFGGKLVPPADH